MEPFLRRVEINKIYAVLYALMFIVLYFVAKPIEVIVDTLWEAGWNYNFFVECFKKNWNDPTYPSLKDARELVKEMWRN